MILKSSEMVSVKLFFMFVNTKIGQAWMLKIQSMQQ